MTEALRRLEPVHVPVSPAAALLDVLLVRARGLLRLLLYAVVAVAPFALEGLFPLSRLGVELLLLVTVSFWAAQRWACPVPVSLSLDCLKLPVMLWIGLGVLQVIPLPPSLVHSLSTLRADKAALLPALLGSTVQSGLEPLSLSVERTLQSLLKLGLLLGLLATARDLMRDRASRRDMLHFLLQVGAVQVVLGLLQLLGQASGPYFVDSWRVADFSFFGSFLNPNRNAAFLNLLWPIALSKGIAAWERDASGRRSSAPRQGSWPMPVYFGLALFLLLGALLCRSRGGWAVTAVLLLAFPCWGRAKRAGLWAGCLLALQMLVPLGLLAAAFWEPIVTTLSNLAQKNQAFGRMDVWASAVRMMRDQTVAGAGLGAFAEAFGPYNQLEQFSAPRHAENVWVEQLVEQGLIGVVGALLALFNLMGLLLRRRVWEEPPGQRALSGMVLGLFGLVLHSLSEQLLRGYGVCVAGIVVLAVLLATLEERGQNSFDPFFRFGVPPRRVWIPFLAIPAVAVLALSLAVGPALHEQAQQGVGGLNGAPRAASPEDSDQRAAEIRFEAQVRAAMTLAPLSAELRQLEAALLLRRFEQENASLKGAARLAQAVKSPLLMEADQHCTEALALGPMNGTTHRLASALQAVRGERARALALITEAVRVSPTDYRNALELGRMRLQAGKREDGLTSLRQALRLMPLSGLSLIVPVVVPVLKAVPEASIALWSEDVPWWVAEAVGQALAQEGRYSEAVLWFETLLDVRDDRTLLAGRSSGSSICPDDPQERPSDFQPARRIALLALQVGDLVLAEEAATHLARCFPSDNLDRVFRARIRARQGDLEEAVSLAKAAASDSGNPVPILLEAVRFYQEAQELDLAEALLRKIQEEHPSSTIGLLAMASFQERVRMDPAAAVETVHLAVRVDPTLEESRLQLYRLYMGLGLEMQAQTQLKTCLGFGRAPRCLTLAGQNKLEEGDPAEAIRLLEQAQEQDPGNREVAQLLERARAGKAALETAPTPSPPSPR